jgi:uncharacterized integral membrane protein
VVNFQVGKLRVQEQYYCHRILDGNHWRGLVISLNTTKNLEWPPDSDHYRAIASVQTMAFSGQVHAIIFLFVDCTFLFHFENQKEIRFYFWFAQKRNFPILLSILTKGMQIEIKCSKI